MRAVLTRWPGAEPPTSAALRESLRREPRSFSTWGNGPGDTYSAHAHSYDKLLVCLRGSITFSLPEKGERLGMRPGDRLFLPAQTTHSAIVGPEGVECAEAHLTPE